MKHKHILILSISILTLTSTLCACSASREIETDGITDDVTETQAVSETEDAEKAQEKTDQALLYELAADFLPEENIEPDPNWQQKIDPEIYTSTVYENGKYLVSLSRHSLSDQLQRDLSGQFAEQTGYYPQRLHALSALYERYGDRFADRYIENRADIIYQGSFTSSFILYASAQEIEKYARSPEVLGIYVFVNAELKALEELKNH